MDRRTPISVKFEIPYFTVSGIQVRYLKIVEKSGYQALREWPPLRRLQDSVHSIGQPVGKADGSLTRTPLSPPALLFSSSLARSSALVLSLSRRLRNSIDSQRTLTPGHSVGAVHYAERRVRHADAEGEGAWCDACADGCLMGWTDALFAFGSFFTVHPHIRYAQPIHYVMTTNYGRLNL